MSIIAKARSAWNDYKIVIVPVLLLSAPASGLLQALHDDARYGFFVEFLGGMISGPIYLVIAFSSVLSFVYIGAWFAQWVHDRGHRWPSSPSDSLLALGMVVGILSTGIWLVPLIWVLSEIPVIGVQIARMGGE